MRDVSRNLDEIELRKFATAFRTWLHRADGSDLLVLPICRRERHRSIAFKELLCIHLGAYKDKYRIQVETGPTT
eukprot:3042095-Karenia_brevis.AAC.1